MGRMMTGSPAGRGCRHGISVLVLPLPAHRGHEESGTGMSSISNPWHMGKGRCWTCSGEGDFAFLALHSHSRFLFTSTQILPFYSGPPAVFYPLLGSSA